MSCFELLREQPKAQWMQIVEACVVIIPVYVALAFGFRKFYGNEIISLCNAVACDGNYSDTK